MINKRLDEIEENIKEINKMIKDDKYFKTLEKSIEYVNQNNNKLKKEIIRYKFILDKIKEEVEYWGYEEKYNDDKIFCKCMKKIHELLEEIE